MADSARRSYLGLAGLVLAAPTCGPVDPDLSDSRRAWPEGTVLAVDGVPVLELEVDRAAESFRLLQPEATENHVRRLALANVVVPRAVARKLAGAERERARQVALDARERLARGDPVDGVGLRLETDGGPKELGYVAWQTAFLLENGAWSEVFEELWSFRSIRVLSRGVAELPREKTFALEIIDFPFLPPHGAIADVEQALGESRLTIVDPAWRTIVPEWIQYRMGTHSTP